MNLIFSWNDFTTATAELPGTGGRIRTVQDDFEVTEEGAYPLSGSGDHVYLWLEKRGNKAFHTLDEDAIRSVLHEYEHAILDGADAPGDGSP